jgi:PBP1b-binding outer membrane lipoprotein LpoB
MKDAVKLLMTAGAAACIASGCATKQATYVEAGGPRTIATVGQINIQDFANAADTMVNSMIETVINTGCAEQDHQGCHHHHCGVVRA